MRLLELMTRQKLWTTHRHGKARSVEPWHKADDVRVPDSSSFLDNGPSAATIVATLQQVCADSENRGRRTLVITRF